MKMTFKKINTKKQLYILIQSDCVNVFNFCLNNVKKQKIDNNCFLCLFNSVFFQ